MLKISSVATPFLQDPDSPSRIRLRIFEWLLIDFLVPLKGAKLVDLGAGPCLFAKLARDAGFDVTAVDARTERKPSDDELGSIRFVQADVRAFPVQDYDIVVNIGLFYHLTLDDQSKLLARMLASNVVILETQIHDPVNLGSAHAERLGELEKVDSYEGVYFKEAKNPMASWKNPNSFWHTEESLTRLIADHGFTTLKKIYPRYMSKYGARQYFVLLSENKADQTSRPVSSR